MVYENHGAMLALAITMPVLGAIAIGLRFYTRYYKKAPLLSDDWLIIPAEVILIVMSVLVIVAVHGHGFGYAIPNETTEGAENGDPPQEILANKMGYAFLMVEALQLAFAKLSIVFFYRRIFCGTKGASVMSVTCWVLIAIISAWGIAFFFANLFQCGTHWSFNWAPPATTNNLCMNITMMNEGYFYSDFILDCIIFILPMYKVWSLQMSVGRRLAVIGILSLGALGVIASGIKVGILVELTHVIKSGFTSGDKLLTKDPDLLNSIIMYWSLIESGLATIVACLPTLNSLLHGTPNLLRSLRSMLSVNSLRSGGSQRSQRSHKSQTRLGSTDHHSQSSQAEINKLEALEAGMGSQAYAMKDLAPQSAPGSKGITVKNYVTQDRTDQV